jgi:hypothetical protein
MSWSNLTSLPVHPHHHERQSARMSSLHRPAPDSAGSYVPIYVTALLFSPIYLVDFADLAIVDLSKAHTPEGRAELAPQLRDALRTNGFIYAINHGYTQAQVSLITPFPFNQSITSRISVIGFSTLQMCRLRPCLPKK